MGKKIHIQFYPENFCLSKPVTLIFVYISVELDLADITSVRCRVCMANGDENICSDDFVSRAFQR